MPDVNNIVQAVCTPESHYVRVWHQMPMCDPIRLLERLQNLIDCLRNQNSGADIHRVANIRSTCIMLIAAIQDEDITPEEAYKMCIRLEDQVSQFFIDKYSYLGDGKDKPKRSE